MLSQPLKDGILERNLGPLFKIMEDEANKIIKSSNMSYEILKQRLEEEKQKHTVNEDNVIELKKEKIMLGFLEDLVKTQAIASRNIIALSEENGTESIIKTIQTDGDKIIDARGQLIHLLINSLGAVRVFAREKPRILPDSVQYLETENENVMLRTEPEREFDKEEFTKLKVQGRHKVVFEEIYKSDVSIKNMFEDLKGKGVAKLDVNSDNPSNSVFLAFGRTGSGKTYNLQCPNTSELGLYTLAAEYILQQKPLNYTLEYSVIENNPLSFSGGGGAYFRDLLTGDYKPTSSKGSYAGYFRGEDTKQRLFQSKRTKGSTNLQIFKEKEITDKSVFNEELLQTLNLRDSSDTNQNQQSSRTHLIIHFIVRKQATTLKEKGKIHSVHTFVDLAGFESSKFSYYDSETDKRRIQQGQAISASLLVLKDAIQHFSKSYKLGTKKADLLTNFLFPVLTASSIPCRVSFLWCMDPFFPVKNLKNQPITSNEVQKIQSLTIESMLFVQSFAEQKNAIAVDDKTVNKAMKIVLATIEKPLISKYTSESYDKPLKDPILNTDDKNWFLPWKKETPMTIIKYRDEANANTRNIVSQLINKEKGQEDTITPAQIIIIENTKLLNESMLDRPENLALNKLEVDLIKCLWNPRMDHLPYFFDETRVLQSTKDFFEAELDKQSIKRTGFDLDEHQINLLKAALDVNLDEFLHTDNLSSEDVALASKQLYRYFGFDFPSTFLKTFEKRVEIENDLLLQSRDFTTSFRIIETYIQKRLKDHKVDLNVDVVTTIANKSKTNGIYAQVAVILGSLKNEMKQSSSGKQMFTNTSTIELVSETFKRIGEFIDEADGSGTYVSLVKNKEPIMVQKDFINVRTLIKDNLSSLGLTKLAFTEFEKENQDSKKTIDELKTKVSALIDVERNMREDFAISEEELKKQLSQKEQEIEDLKKKQKKDDEDDESEEEKEEEEESDNETIPDSPKPTRPNTPDYEEDFDVYESEQDSEFEEEDVEGTIYPPFVISGNKLRIRLPDGSERDHDPILLLADDENGNNDVIKPPVGLHQKPLPIQLENEIIDPLTKLVLAFKDTDEKIINDKINKMVQRDKFMDSLFRSLVYGYHWLKKNKNYSSSSILRKLHIAIINWIMIYLSEKDLKSSNDAVNSSLNLLKRYSGFILCMYNMIWRACCVNEGAFPKLLFSRKGLISVIGKNKLDSMNLIAKKNNFKDDDSTEILEYLIALFIVWRKNLENKPKMTNAKALVFLYHGIPFFRICYWASTIDPTEFNVTPLGMLKMIDNLMISMKVMKNLFANFKAVYNNLCLIYASLNAQLQQDIKETQKLRKKVTFDDLEFFNFGLNKRKKKKPKTKQNTSLSLINRKWLTFLK